MSHDTPAPFARFPHETNESRAIQNLVDDLRAQLAASEAAVATLRSERAEQRAVIEAVEAGFEGQPISDFLLSFHPVRRAVDLQADVATLRTDLGTALSVGVAQHAEIATLRQALAEIRSTCEYSNHSRFSCDITNIYNISRDALAAVPAPAAPQE